MFVATQPRRSLDSFSGLTTTPCPPLVLSVTEGFHNSFLLIFMQNAGGCMGGISSTTHYSMPTLHYPLSFQTLAHSFALFCTHAKLNSFIFKRFRTLCEKQPGVGYPFASQLSASELALPPVVKWRKLLRPAQTDT